MKDKLKGVLIATGVIAALATGGAAIAGATGGDHGDKAITGSALDRASAAALRATGGGKVTQTETGDEDSYYEVEVTKADGSQTDVQLDKQFNVVAQKADHEDNGADEQGDRGDHDAITGSALDRASAVALKETGGGKVTETEQGDEESYYQVEVTKPDGSQTDVNLDRAFKVVKTKTEHEGSDGGE
jgi:uncharacterized membrane protein YkoI